MKVTPFGASGTVTGSCHLVETSGFKLLLDCGLYQGQDEEKNTMGFGFEPASVDAIVLGHAHLDHIGRALPSLVAGGFSGPVYATPPTLKLLPLMLEDALKVMQEEAARRGAKVLLNLGSYGTRKIYPPSCSV